MSGDASVLPASVQGTDTVCCTFALNYVHLTAQVLVPALRHYVDPKQKVYRDSPNPEANLWEYIELLYLTGILSWYIELVY